ncbi:MAG: phosphonopyruvate decarboxylase, partial [Limisphaerales bacterium]
QNSGLGNMVNPLTSLNQPFRVPTLLITTWRGEPGLKDEPQHGQMGRITHRLLETLEIPWRKFPEHEADIPAALDEAEAVMDGGRPFAFVMSHGAVADCELCEPRLPPALGAVPAGAFAAAPPDRLTRTGLLELALAELRGDEAIIATTGKTGRELFTLADRPNHLYVVGGMGGASAIGLGLARVRPQQPVVVLDGDGAALMKLGNLATIGFCRPTNLLHVLVDNEAHDSTGGQRTVSGRVDFAAIAAAANYRHARRADRPEDIRAALRELRGLPGPSLLHVKIRAGSPANLGRPTVPPHEVKERFMAWITR